MGIKMEVWNQTVITRQRWTLCKTMLLRNSFLNFEYVSYLLPGILMMSKFKIHRASLPFALGALLWMVSILVVYLFGQLSLLLFPSFLYLMALATPKLHSFQCPDSCCKSKKSGLWNCVPSQKEFFLDTNWSFFISLISPSVSFAANPLAHVAWLASLVCFNHLCFYELLWVCKRFWQIFQVPTLYIFIFLQAF